MRCNGTVARSSSGLLLVDKPVGWTSARVVRTVRRHFCGARTGHAGTLDPAATGLLIIGVGEGTKVLHYLLGQSKFYEARVILGVKTTTGDGEGRVVETRGYPRPEKELLEKLLRSFVGEIRQTPPMYSAVKVGGQRLYKLARRQYTVERKPRNVTIYSLTLKRCLEDGFSFGVHCSKGTYVRVLAEDMGSALGTVAHLASLRRVRSGVFSVDDAMDMQTLDKCRSNPEELSSRLLPVDAGLAHLPSIRIDPLQSARMRQGREVRDFPENDHQAEDEMYRIYDADGFLLAVAVKTSGCLRSKRIFHRR